MSDVQTMPPASAADGEAEARSPATGAKAAERPAGRPRPELSAAKLALRDARLRGLSRSASLAPRARGGDLPLSFAQERLWFLERLQPGQTSYNIGDGTRLSGPLDTQALERALGEIIHRHESLRTVFRDVDGVPAQVIVPFAGFVLPVDDLSALGEAEREEEARRRTEEEAERPFDLQAGPLFRARLLRLGAEEHVLSYAMHHIVSDGWSIGVLFSELWTLYGAYRAGRTPPLPPLAIQYADYAAWQREQLQGPALERHLAYWRGRLAGAPEVLELPTDRPRPAVPSSRGGTVPVRVPSDVLRALGEAEGATLYMVVLAAFQLLLSRYAGTPDVVVGTPVAGRTRKEVEGLIGFFVNTLVVRTELSGDPTFRELVRRVRARLLEDLGHQEVPFERLVGELQPERTLSHSPLFQVMFQLDSEPEPAAEVEGLRVAGMGGEQGISKFDLSLVLDAGSHGLAGGLEYALDLFEPATAARMVEHLRRVLAQVSADPDRRISAVELVDAAERDRVAAWNRTAAPYPADRCIHQLFEAQAERTPDAVAVVCGEESLTYRELEERANRLAHHLRRLGVGPEVRVGLCLERGPELPAALLAVMKAGGAWVPTDPSHPAERLAYVLEDAGVSVLLTQARLRGRMPARDGVRIVAVDAEWGRIAGESAARPESGVTPENLAYVIYTSGSTGRPKGVAMHHRGVGNYIDWGVRFYRADQGAGAPLFTSLAVDLTLTSLLPLFAGRPVHLLPEEGAVEALARLLRQGPGFGLIKITPIHLALLGSMLQPGELAAATHALVIGGDVLSAGPARAWREHAPGVRLINEYGPTETVVGCSAGELAAGALRDGVLPVGGPIQNLAFHLLDPRGHPVPVGLPGELYIGGAGVARGYLGRPALTAETFVPDPFAGPGARMYRTVDRARRLPDGGITILGRMDRQVKVRGYRVELGEIEAVLRRDPSVSGCLVVVREDRPGDRRLVAYVAGRADAQALRTSLRRSLPDYMVPDAFVVMDALPRTATGKLDPRTLPAPVPPGVVEGDAPRDYVEARLILLWEELLGVRGIGTGRSWFDLGGNSLLALRLFTRANRAFGCDLPVSTLFAGATVRHMAAAILAQQSAAPAAPGSVVPLQPDGSLPPVFFVHSGDRNVMGYVNLVRHLGPDQPAFGVRDTGEDLGRPIERIAAEHVAAIRRVQPRGPYSLASWSFGGLVVFEMALQLERAGEAVAFVGLLDTMSPTLCRHWPHPADEVLLVGLAGEAAESVGRAFSMATAELEGLELEEKVRRVADALRAQDAVPAEFTAAALDEAFRAVRARNRSSLAYVPADRFSGTLTLFRAREGSPHLDAFFAACTEEETRALGWHAHVAGSIDMHVIPGSHVTLASEPHVRVLAKRMRASLAAARAPAVTDDHGPSPVELVFFG